jgi:pimeloyl-ACP methyl ester carboxylesterase
MQTRTRADWADLAEALADVGIGSIAFDLRGHGGSAPGPDGLGAPANMSSSVADVKAARAFLAARLDAVAPGRVGMAGASVGANLALAAAAADPTVRAVVLLSAGIDYRGLRGDAAFRKYGKRPALLVASLEDSYATRSARAFARLDAAAYEIRLVSGAGHGTVMLARQPDLIDTIVDWFRRTLL